MDSRFLASALGALVTSVVVIGLWLSFWALIIWGVVSLVLAIVE